MLYLLERKGSSYFLICGQIYTLGRKNTDILIEDDQSLSRHHATIKIGLCSAVVIDNGSKYKIQINGTEIEPNTDVRIQDGDVIKFGRMHSIYKFKRVAIITTASGLEKPQKHELKSIIENLGGKLCQDWLSNCTHLTLNEITLTIKYLHCLLDNKPAVTVDYWSKILESAKKKLPAPKIEDYKPPIVETLISGQDFNSDLERKNLFAGKIFVFTNNKRQAQMSDIIAKCGGRSILWNSQKLTVQNIVKNSNRYLFIQCDTNETIPESLKIVYNEIKKLQQRLIPLSEIAFAIYYGTCEKNCNPNFNVVEGVFQTKLEIVDHIPVVNATQTQDLQTHSVKEEHVIMASFDIPLQDVLPLVKQENTRNIDDKNNNKEISDNINKKRKADDEALPSSSRNFAANNVEQAVIGDDVGNRRDSKKCRLVNPFSLQKENITTISDRKRKADEDLLSSSRNLVDNSIKETVIGVDGRNAKKSRFENPFSLKKTVNEDLNIPKSADNPFAKVRNQVIDEIKPITDNNPFVNVRIKNEPSTVDPAISPKSKPNTSDTSLFETTSTSPNSNISATGFSTSGWIKIERSSQSTTTVIKIEDEDMQKIFDKFKNTVITGAMPDLLRKDLTDLTTQTTSTLNNGGGSVNYKKFKKVVPLLAKVNVLNATINRSMGSVQSVAIEQISEEENDEAEEQVPVCLPKGKRNISKKFNF